jgi:hypothetical protein
MNHLLSADYRSQTRKIKFKGEDIMDIGNKLIKDNMTELKETSNKEKKSTGNKQGCIKMNDYFSF